jgi:hypothetical protein
MSRKTENIASDLKYESQAETDRMKKLELAY